MYIAICDDDFEVSCKLSSDVCAFFEGIKEEYEIFAFSSGLELIKTIKKETKQFNILLLDIDMPDMSGFEVANVIRENNEDIIIIFISSHDNYVFDSFQYNPFRYIRKNRISEELSIVLKSAYALCKKRERKHYVLIFTDDGQYKVEQSEIFYFEIIKRKLYVHLTDNRVLSTWKTIKEFIKELDSNDFVKIHSGCAVNMKYIKGYSNYDVTLDNEEKLLASRNGIKQLKDELTRYWGENV